MSWTIWVQFLQGVAPSCSLSAILHGTEPVSTLTHALLYCCTLTIFSVLDFVGGDLALTGFSLLTWTSNFHCFGSLGVWPGSQGPGLGHMCWPSTWAWLQLLRSLRAKVTIRLGNGPLVFFELSKNNWKQGPTVRVIQPSTPRPTLPSPPSFPLPPSSQRQLLQQRHSRLPPSTTAFKVTFGVCRPWSGPRAPALANATVSEVHVYYGTAYAFLWLECRRQAVLTVLLQLAACSSVLLHPVFLLVLLDIGQSFDGLFLSILALGRVQDSRRPDSQWQALETHCISLAVWQTDDSKIQGESGLHEFNLDQLVSSID